MSEVKKRRRGFTRVSAKHQVTIPKDALGAAGMEVGDVVKVEADGAGRIVLTRQRDPLAEHAGALTGVYEVDEVDRLRDGWE